MDIKGQVAKILRKHIDFGTLMPTHEDLQIATQIHSLYSAEIAEMINQINILGIESMRTSFDKYSEANTATVVAYILDDLTKYLKQKYGQQEG